MDKITRIEQEAKKKFEEKKQREAEAKEKQQKKLDEEIHTFTGKELRTLSNQVFIDGFKDGQLKLLEKQIKQKEDEEAKPVTLVEQLKDFEEKIKYQRLKEIEKLNDRKLTALITSIARELETTLRSLLELERQGLIVYIDETTFRKKLEQEGQPSRINSTTRKNLDIIAWAVEQLKVCSVLLLGQNGTHELPLELYPVSKSTHNQEIKKYFKLAEKRERKAKAMLKKQEQQAV